jgi:hypothetical protein
VSELDRIELEGVIVEPGEEAPLTDPDEARSLVEGAFLLIKEGFVRREQGVLLLQEAERRLAWKVLGFDSMDDCMLAGISQHLRTSIEPAARSELVITLRRNDQLSTRTIAKAFDCSHSTIVRDLRIAREQGRLANEPERITSQNGRMRRSTVQQSTRRRPDLAKTWRTAVDDITRRTKTLAQLCGDDRYRDRREDLTIATRGDLQRAHAILTSVLADFEQHQNNGEN